MKSFYHKIIIEKNDFEELIDEIKTHDFIAIDTETTGLGIKDYIVGVSIAFDLDKGYYIPLRHIKVSLIDKYVDKQLDAEYVFSKLKPIIEDPEKIILGWHWGFDNSMFIKEGIRRDYAIDVMIMGHLVDERKVQNLKDRYGIEFDIPHLDKIKDFSDTHDFSKVDIVRGGEYAAFDAVMTYRLFILWKSYFELDPDLMNILKIECKVVPTVAKMETVGIKIDKKKLKNLTEKLVQKLKEIEKELSSIAPDLNFSSSQQLAKLLYCYDGEQEEKLFSGSGNCFGLPILDKTDTDQPSTDHDALTKLMHYLENKNKTTGKAYKFLSLLLEYKKLTKRYDAFFKPYVNMEGDVIHARFKQTGTESGRFSCTSPNLQQLPRDADEFDIRSCFIPREGKIIYKIDWSAMEMRLAAALSNDPILKEAIAGGDPHKTTAQFLFPGQEITKKLRSIGKTVNFAILYGATKFRIAALLNIDPDEAEVHINRFFTNYPVLKQFFDRIEMDLFTKRYIKLYLGRRRHVSEFPSSDEIRSSKNIMIQGCIHRNTTIILDKYGKTTVETAYKKKLDQTNLIKTPFGYKPFKITFSGLKRVYIVDVGISKLKVSAEQLFFVTKKKIRDTVYIKDTTQLRGKYYFIKTRVGRHSIKKIKKTSKLDRMYDISILDGPPAYYGNGILLHNSGANIMKNSMWQIAERKPKSANFIAQIHDEFVFEVDPEDVFELDKLCHDVMEIEINGIKLIADAEIGKNLSKGETMPFEYIHCPLVQAKLGFYKETEEFISDECKTCPLKNDERFRKIFASQFNRNKSKNI